MLNYEPATPRYCPTKGKTIAQLLQKQIESLHQLTESILQAQSLSNCGQTIFSSAQPHFIALAIVKLRSHRLATFSRNPIGFAAIRFHKAALLQLFEDIQFAVRQHKSFARKACHVDYFAMYIAHISNTAALRQNVQNTLFQF